MGGAVLAAVVVVVVVPLFTLLFKLIRAFVVSLLVGFVTDWGGVVDVVGFVAAASAAFKLAAAVFGVFVLTTAVPDENEENVESNDEDFMIQLLLMAFIFP